MMALVKKLKAKEVERTSVHTEVEATFHAFEKEGNNYLQIDTYGKAGRHHPGKVSQSLQFDAEGIRELRLILDRLA